MISYDPAVNGTMEYALTRILISTEEIKNIFMKLIKLKSRYPSVIVFPEELFVRNHKTIYCGISTIRRDNIQIKCATIENPYLVDYHNNVYLLDIENVDVILSIDNTPNRYALHAPQYSSPKLLYSTTEDIEDSVVTPYPKTVMFRDESQRNQYIVERDYWLGVFCQSVSEI